jgi:hypothetical protein
LCLPSFRTAVVVVVALGAVDVVVVATGAVVVVVVGAAVVVGAGRGRGRLSTGARRWTTATRGAVVGGTAAAGAVVVVVAGAVRPGLVPLTCDADQRKPPISATTPTPAATIAVRHPRMPYRCPELGGDQTAGAYVSSSASRSISRPSWNVPSLPRS